MKMRLPINPYMPKVLLLGLANFILKIIIPTVFIGLYIGNILQPL